MRIPRSTVPSSAGASADIYKSKPMMKLPINTRAIINGQEVSVKVLKYKRWFFIDWVLVSFGNNVYYDGVFQYTSRRVKWIRKSKLL